MHKKGMITGCICMILLVVSLAAGIWMIRYRPVERSATQEEIDAHSVYFVDWKRASCWQAGMTEKELILSLCSEEPDDTDPAVFYESNSLRQMLYQCGSVEEICLSDEVLSINYVATDGSRVTLRYSDDTPAQLWVYDQKRDRLYAENQSGATVTTNYYQSLRQRVR